MPIRWLFRFVILYTQKKVQPLVIFSCLDAVPLSKVSFLHKFILENFDDSVQMTFGRIQFSAAEWIDLVIFSSHCWWKNAAVKKHAKLLSVVDGKKPTQEIRNIEILQYRKTVITRFIGFNYLRYWFFILAVLRFCSAKRNKTCSVLFRNSCTWLQSTELFKCYDFQRSSLRKYQLFCSCSWLWNATPDWYGSLLDVRERLFGVRLSGLSRAGWQVRLSFFVVSFQKLSAKLITSCTETLLERFWFGFRPAPKFQVFSCFVRLFS